jgi:hypothetical protein
MSVTRSGYLLGTSASKIFIVGKGVGIASASPAGSRRMALRIACEAAVRVAGIIVKAILLRVCDRPPHRCGRSWRRAKRKCGKCDCQRSGYLANRLHNSLHKFEALVYFAN